MTDLRPRSFSDLLAGLNAGQHLAVDAVVAFVDGELGPGARDRAAAHLTECQSCGAEVAAQRQARSVRDIPQTADLPGPPIGLAVSAEGNIVEVADPSRPAGLGGPSPRWGPGPSALGRWMGR